MQYIYTCIEVCARILLYMYYSMKCMGVVCDFPVLLIQLIVHACTHAQWAMDERRIYCTHCGVFMSRKTYLAHKRVYYDKSTDQWIKRRELDPESK